VRHATAGLVDRSRPLNFTFDGRRLTGFAGDTLASALLANGIHTVATSVNLDRRRGIVAAGSEEPCAIVQIESPYPEPMLTATTVELYDGLVATSLPGRGRLAATGDTARYDSVWAHCECLVVGAGPAGIAAAAEAAQAGGRVILVDERPPGPEIPAGVRALTRTTAVGYYEDNFITAVQRRTNHLGGAASTGVARERLWRIRAASVVLATGAHERLVAFPDNDLPGVMLAGAACEYLHRYGVLAGHRAVVHTNNDTAYGVAADLAAAGIEIVVIADTRAGATTVDTGTEVIASARIDGVRGRDRVEAVVVNGAEYKADLLLVSGGFSPVLHLYSQAGGRLRFDEALGAFVPDGCRQRVQVVGAAAGTGLPRTGPPTLPEPSDVDERIFVDLQRDVTLADIRRATAAGLRSVEHVKRFTTAGTAHDQGKTSGLLTSAAVAASLGADVGSVGMTTFRPPYLPVSFAVLAGRERGDLFDPSRVTAMHDWHVAHGATFENVGQWKRAWYYPFDGEDMRAAVARECVAARTDVAMMDVSTLGKIDVHGPDAAEFLDRLYTNMMSTLAVGSVRYGVMCHADGMVFDDGTVARLAADRFLLTTTTGNAAAVLEWMEEWLQTEWPSLRAWCTSVTDQWATAALVGPGSRTVLAGLAPDLAVDAAIFPFMTWRDATVAGLDARVFRISFSGELAYEINVPTWYGLALWQALADEGVTPYGTETMHVLRAEKGYPIVGQDTDGTVTPHDLGLSWAVSKTKRDFIGMRSLSRPDTCRPDRKHLVGLLPEDPSLLLAEGTHLVESTVLGAPPVPYLGHVTSSYHSQALGRTFALALVAGGRDRIGTDVYAVVDGVPTPVQVANYVLYDPKGERRDG
jgi:sarcosine oxidase subunit alpha